MLRNKKISVKFYSSISGKEPVKEWLLALEKEERKGIGLDIKTVEYSWPIGMPVCRPLKDGLYEIRSNVSRGKIARIIFCIERQTMVLLHAFIKKTQVIPDH